MAKKKKHKVSGIRRRKHSFGAVAQNTMIDSGSVIAGAILGGMINKIVPATVNDKLLAGGKVILGIGLPMLIKGKGHNVAKGIGNGILAVGSVDLLKSFGVLSGDFDIPVVNGIDDEINGDIPVINGDLIDENTPIGEDVLGESDEMGEDVLGEDEY